MPLSITLQPGLPDRDPEQPLASLLERIYEERGHFRHLTEQSLAEEANQASQASKPSTSIEDAPDEADSVKPDVPDHDTLQKEVYASRTDMLNAAQQAQNEASLALDFISLLLSRHTPAQAAKSISPVLQQAAPTGSLSFDKTPVPAPTARPSPSQQPPTLPETPAAQTAFGWTLDSLNTAADTLSARATALEATQRREARYWAQVLGASEAGWSVCRMPRGRGAVGVRFGSMEAAPLFYARSLAALQPDADGRLVLQQEPGKGAVGLRVRIMRNGKVVEESGVTEQMLGGDGKATAGLEMDLEMELEQELEVEAREARTAEDEGIVLGRRIRVARDRLFDEELFQACLVEARALLSQGVQVRGDAVRIAEAPEPEAWIESSAAFSGLVVDLAPSQNRHSDGDGVGSGGTRASEQRANTADLVVLALRILLIQAHKHRFEQRTKLPLPLGEERPRSEQEDGQGLLAPLVKTLREDRQLSRDGLLGLLGRLAQAD